uniref:Cell division control protein 2 homolog A n=1 Tax=Rhizophora mucronata TaxID=61149 RepID=A0A2P2IMM0_RHIMU
MNTSRISVLCLDFICLIPGEADPISSCCNCADCVRNKRAALLAICSSFTLLVLTEQLCAFVHFLSYSLNGMEAGKNIHLNFRLDLLLSYH